MSFTSCPNCGSKLYTSAVSCPRCQQIFNLAMRAKHELDAKAEKEPDPTCYKCQRSATTRCHGCGRFSCPIHINPYSVANGKFVARELLCPACIEQVKQKEKNAWVILAGAMLIALAIILFGAWNRSTPKQPFRPHDRPEHRLPVDPWTPGQLPRR